MDHHHQHPEPETHPDEHPQSQHLPWPQHAWSAAESFPSTDVSGKGDLVLAIPDHLHHPAIPPSESHVITDHFPPVDPHVFTSLSSEWECEESLDDVPAHPQQDDHHHHNHSTEEQEDGGSAQRVLFGDLTWSRGIFSPDGKGGMSFRFVSSDMDTHTDDLDPAEGVMSISESDLHAAVGSQVDDPLAVKVEETAPQATDHT